MVRFLLLLTFLLLNLIRSNDALAQWCSIGSQTNGQWSYSSIYGPDAAGTAWCQQYLCTNSWWQSQISGCPNTCQTETQTQTLSCPSGYNGTITQTNTKSCPAGTWSGWTTTSNTCVSTCQQVSETQTLSCPANYSGQITQTRIKTCPDNQWQAWQTTQNTCVANPPTCQTSSQQQTQVCPTGYTGSITQTRSSTCPNPYGSPVWQPWVTTSDTCKKAVTNPTNPVSPVNPASPTSPTSNTSVQTTQSSPATVSTPNTAPNSVATPTDSTTTTQETKPAETKTDAPTTTVSPTTSSTSKDIPSPSVPKGKTTSVVGLVLSLELYQKPGFTQPNVFPEVSIVQGIPNDILMHDKNLMGLIQQPSYDQSFEVPDLGFEQ